MEIRPAHVPRDNDQHKIFIDLTIGFKFDHVDFSFRNAHLPTDDGNTSRPSNNHCDFFTELLDIDAILGEPEKAEGNTTESWEESKKDPEKGFVRPLPSIAVTDIFTREEFLQQYQILIEKNIVVNTERKLEPVRIEHNIVLKHMCK